MTKGAIWIMQVVKSFCNGRFTLGGLKLISDSVMFLMACLDRESEGLTKDRFILWQEVEKLVKEAKGVK